MEEIWKDIEGYGGLYQISNLGKAKSFWFGREHFLKLNSSNGYNHISLCINGNLKIYRIHKLVAQAFIPNPDNKPQVNHIDGNKLNNRAENLEWCTASENIQHAFDTGLKKVTENHYFIKNHPMKGKFGKDHICSIQVNQYSLDGEFIKKWDSATVAMRNIGISQQNISHCCNLRRKTAGGFIWKFSN